MQIGTTIAALGFFGAFATASPVEADMGTNKLEARGTASVSIFHGDSCTDQADSFTIYQGGYRCDPYTNVRSIGLSNR
ncbi:hypothetical protein PG985_001869 [Apiospora marii]|uniref:uncharacterized protein n=1 Tax=Apiospora marii TaxID=335849 RepID=UPI00312E0DD6